MLKPASVRIHDGPGEVAPAEEPLLQRIEPVLPAAHLLVRGQSVFDEVQRAARLEDPPHLAQRGGGVGDGAQRPGGQRGVVAVVGHGSDCPSRPARRPGPATPRGAWPPASSRRRRARPRRPGDGRRVEGDIEPRPEPDLDDRPCRPSQTRRRSSSACFMPQATLMIRGSTCSA